MKILVVRVGRAGDMVLITPALKAILAKYPDAEVHLLTSPDGRRVLRGFDRRITKMLLYERKGFGVPFKRRRLGREIAAGDYRHVYCFETKPSFRRLFEPTNAAVHVIGHSGVVISFAERCLRVVTGDLPDKPIWAWLPVTEAGKQTAQRMLAAAGIDDDSFVVGFHPSFSGLRKSYLRSRVHRHQKAWPLAAFGALAKLLTEHATRQEIMLRLVADLLPDERALGEELAAAADGRVTLFTEPPDFERYKATIARLNLLVTPNTGPMHIAAAVGTRMVALFSELDPVDCGPYVPPEQFIVLRAEDTPTPERGLEAIDPDSVFQACRRFLPR